MQRSARFCRLSWSTRSHASSRKRDVVEADRAADFLHVRPFIPPGPQDRCGSVLHGAVSSDGAVGASRRRRASLSGTSSVARRFCSFVFVFFRHNSNNFRVAVPNSINELEPSVFRCHPDTHPMRRGLPNRVFPQYGRGDVDVGEDCRIRFSRSHSRADAAARGTLPKRQKVIDAPAHEDSAIAVRPWSNSINTIGDAAGINHSTASTSSADFIGIIAFSVATMVAPGTANLRHDFAAAGGIVDRIVSRGRCPTDGVAALCHSARRYAPSYPQIIAIDGERVEMHVST